MHLRAQRSSTRRSARVQPGAFGRQQWLEPSRTGSQFLDYFSWTGTMDPSAYLSVPAAIDFQEAHDWADVGACCHALASRTRARIEARTGLPSVCTDSAVWYAQMFTARLPAQRWETLREHLWREHRIEIPICQWNDQPLIRVLVQAYVGHAHMDRLVAALERLLAG